MSHASEPAYPGEKALRFGQPNDVHTGLTKREAFAMAALPAVLAAYVEANGRCIGTDHVAYNTAAHAVRIADALLAELAKDQP